jgi:hypothetical protein
MLAATAGKADPFIEWAGLAIPLRPRLIYEPAKLFLIYNKKAGLTGQCCTFRVGLCSAGPCFIWER